jgi:hypothetical protein
LTWRRELRPVNLLLLAGSVFVLVAIIHIWWDGGSLPSQNQSAKGITVPTAPIIRDQQPLSAFKMVATKNLFSQDRSAPTSDIAKVQDSLEGFELFGVMILGDTRAAIIGGRPKGRTQGALEIESVYMGEDWHGLKILEISNESVTFSGKEGRKTLKFPE